MLPEACPWRLPNTTDLDLIENTFTAEDAEDFPEFNNLNPVSVPFVLAFLCDPCGKISFPFSWNL
jgi:hypothetical protein